MNTLHELRATLDHHAHDVADDPSYARVAAVRGRARRVRQQRAGGVLAAAVLAVAGIVLVPSLGDRGPQPAAAPDTMTSLGWTYRLASTESGDGRVTVELGDSDTPRLVSWATPDDGQRVAVRQPGQLPRNSDSGDYADFTWVPPGPGGRVTVTSASGAGLDVAVYTLDESVTPPGVGEGVLTFREDVAGMTFLGATLGEPGEASIEVEVTPTKRMVWLGTTCEDLPRGVRVNYNWADEKGSFSSGACDSGSSFDPGGSPGTGFEPGRHAGQPSTLRMWLTRGDDEPIADGELPGVRLGLGAYTFWDRPVRLTGTTEVAREVEHDGRVWELDSASMTDVQRNGRLPFVSVPEEREEAGPFVVTDAIKGRGALRYSLTVDGRRVGSSTTFLGTGGGGSGDLMPVEPGVRVSMRVGTPLERVDEAGIAVYRRAPD